MADLGIFHSGFRRKPRKGIRSPSRGLAFVYGPPQAEDSVSWLLVSVWLTLGMVDQSAAISTPAASAYELGNAFYETLDWTTGADLGFDAQFFGHYHVTAGILSFQAPGPFPEFSASLETFSIGAYATFGDFTFGVSHWCQHTLVSQAFDPPSVLFGEARTTAYVTIKATFGGNP